ncbi:transporter substrate-binding domain-containing protein [Pectobacterium carotovorum]|uniref:transporter substrate-binding domain-containing protein n=1 Tax=Pectobacterium carotovorum TaxID=554 RepID=UPI0029D53092|nr:transporter substrate-binding domain-containing protein [Pectobacterium carotovorum]MDX6916556.1 transporter substrate-binding domain-containing protein [Pectobacterium carotovorum]
MKKCWLALLLVAGGASAQSHLDAVQQQGVLTVCTTGDYKPYSFLRSDGGYEGIDISMAESLAKSLGVKLNWVQTTWKTLMTDFQAGKCDIAMGGISVTLQRQKNVFFTQPLDVDGKIPLVRCENKDRYQTIEQLNRPTVRLIEPAGGTNEAFAHAFLPQAALTLHDNVTIFQQLVDKKADVMITEASEALFQQKQHPELCAINPAQPLQYGEKAYMLPRDDMSWKLYVDQWLHLTKATGEYQKIVGEWLAVAP